MTFHLEDVPSLGDCFYPSGNGTVPAGTYADTDLPPATNRDNLCTWNKQRQYVLAYMRLQKLIRMHKG